MRWLIRWALRFLPRPFLIRISYLVTGLFRLFLRGKAVTCPVCGSSFRRFLPYGVRSRSNVLCPACLSLERHRLIWLYLERESDFLTLPRRVLHVAPEQCFHGRFRKMAHLEYVTGDLESPLADHHFDLHGIPFSDASFDLVLCNHVLEHVEDDLRVMGEILRILRPGGFAILQVPLDDGRKETFEDPAVTDPRQREKMFGQKDHVRVYGLDYADRLRASGFDVEEYRVDRHFSPEEVGKFRLAPGETLHIARKPQ